MKLTMRLASISMTLLALTSCAPVSDQNRAESGSTETTHADQSASEEPKAVADRLLGAALKDWDPKVLEAEAVPELKQFGISNFTAMQPHLTENIDEVRILLRKYSDRSQSLADACLIRMSELNPRHALFTLDSDFLVYRKQGRKAIQLIFPE